MLGEWARRAGFWSLDLLRGGHIRKKYRELAALRRKENKNAKALEEVLQHAVATVPAYAAIQFFCIDNFPVVNKNTYRENFEVYRSTKYRESTKIRKVYTSGSTGTPFMAYQDSEKLAYHRAGLLLINKQIGWNLGDRYMFMRVWKGAHQAGKLQHLLQNTIPVEVTDISKEHLERLANRLVADKHVKIILGYASYLDTLVTFLEEKGYIAENLGIKLVISDSECLKKDVQKRIARMFQCPVLDRYANNENGIIALTSLEDDALDVNWPEYYVELLSLDSDEPVALGEIGRIVITDLYNKAFPFIRYDTGDLGIASKMEGKQVLQLKSIVGRVSDVLTNTEGKSLGEAVITAAFENYIPLKRYQIVQKQGIYEMRIEKPFLGEEQYLLEKLKDLFGKDATIQLSYVDTIPCEKNGKFKTTVREQV